MILECKAIDFKYGEVPVLEQVSFTVAPGNFCAILGKNGCGKTTLLHCLNGILTPQGGAVELGGDPLNRMSQREISRRVSLVTQEHMEIFPFKVLDVVVMGRAPFLGLTSVPTEDDYQLARTTLRSLNSEHLAESSFNKISGGERQVALLASALVQASDIMLLDEPTNHLDFKNKFHLLLQIKKLCRARGISIIAAMHDPNLINLFADQVVMLRRGRIIETGPAGKVMTAANITDLYETETVAREVMPGKPIFLPKVLMDESHDEQNTDNR